MRIRWKVKGGPVVQSWDSPPRPPQNSIDRLSAAYKAVGLDTRKEIPKLLPEGWVIRFSFFVFVLGVAFGMLIGAYL